LKTSECFLITLFSGQEKLLKKLTTEGYQNQKHWVCMT
jgi:hypothetical protein